MLTPHPPACYSVRPPTAPSHSPAPLLSTPPPRPTDPESERRLDEEVGSLVDLLLGTAPPPSPSATYAAAARSRSVPARLDRLAGAGLRTSRSRGVLAPAAAPPASPAAAAPEQAVAEGEAAGPPSEPGSPTSSGGLCMICMDRAVRVQVRFAFSGWTPHLRWALEGGAAYKQRARWDLASALPDHHLNLPNCSSHHSSPPPPPPPPPRRWLSASTSSALAARAGCARSRTTACRSAPLTGERWAVLRWRPPLPVWPGKRHNPACSPPHCLPTSALHPLRSPVLSQPAHQRVCGPGHRPAVRRPQGQQQRPGRRHRRNGGVRCVRHYCPPNAGQPSLAQPAAASSCARPASPRLHVSLPCMHPLAKQNKYLMLPSLGP